MRPTCKNLSHTPAALIRAGRRGYCTPGLSQCHSDLSSKKAVKEAAGFLGPLVFQKRLLARLGQHLAEQLDCAFQAPVGRNGLMVLKGGRLRSQEPVGRPVGSLERKRAMQLGWIDGVATSIILGCAHSPFINGV